MESGLSIQPAETAAESLLRWALERFGDRVALACGFGVEDLVVLDLLARVHSRPRVITVDTGRLPEETYQLMQAVRDRYRVSVEVHFPDVTRVEEMVSEHGINLFLNSPDKRRFCCRVRKEETLQRALQGLSAWITGTLQKGEVRPGRAVRTLEREEGGRLRINPLADWSRDQVWEYVRNYHVPYHPFYDRGYRSIGCAPCTRPVAPGEASALGCWWWEERESHVH